MIYQRNLDSVRLVSGANFPMLAEAGLLAMSGGGLQEVYECALESGRAGVMGTDSLASDKGPDNDDDLF